MTRVVPSQVVELIEQTWPTAADNMTVHSADGGPISGVVQLVSEIPPELITLSGKDYSDFITLSGGTSVVRSNSQQKRDNNENRWC
jgi:hypothetical protein